jgi:ribose transport system substrate-binding protein
MKRPRFLLSLTTNDNDYQVEQAATAQEAANRLQVDLEIIYADNDAIQQSQQLLKIIQSNSASHPDGILFEPVGGTGLPQVARAAAAAGIAWVVLNREVEYIADLRREFRLPIFGVSSDHEEIGRIQGRQISALLPQGGSILLVQGPAESLAAKQRTTGMYETKPIGLQVKVIKASWTEASSYKAISSWLKLSTSLQTPIDLVAAQDDSMAVGAKKAFQEITDNAARDKFWDLPFLGIDGVRNTGQSWVKRGLLTSTVIVPTSADQGVEMLAHAVQTGTIPEALTLTTPKSLPSIEELEKKPARRAHAARSF